MSDIRVRVHEGHHVSVVKEKTVSREDLEILGITEEQFVEYIENDQVEPNFIIEGIEEVDDPKDPRYYLKWYNGQHVDDVLYQLISESDCVNSDPVEDWVSDRKGYTEVTMSIMEEGEALWR